VPGQHEQKIEAYAEISWRFAPLAKVQRSSIENEKMRLASRDNFVCFLRCQPDCRRDRRNHWV